MAEYIELTDLWSAPFDYIIDTCGSSVAQGFIDRVNEIKPADVRPVKHGKWEWRRRHRGGFRRVTGEDVFGVSHTITVDQRYVIDDPYCPFCGKLNESVFLNFCPNCGADMMDETIVEAEGK